MLKSIRIVSPDGEAISTKITNAETGEEIHGVERVEIEIVAGDINHAQVKLCAVQTDVKAAAVFVMSHPTTGDLKSVKRIEFFDAETIEFETRG